MNFFVGDRVQFNEESLRDVTWFIRPLIRWLDRRRGPAVVLQVDRYRDDDVLSVQWKSGPIHEMPASMFDKIGESS